MFSLLVPPAELPVTVEEFREHLWNIFDGHDSDTLLTSLLQAATARAEAFTGLRLMRQTWRMETTLPGAGEGVVLPYGFFAGVDALSLSADGLDWTAADPSLAAVDTSGVLPAVFLEGPGLDGARLVRIDWTCGKESRDEVPGDIRMAIKQLAAHWYRLRAATALDSEEGVPRAVPFSFTALLTAHRLNFIPVPGHVTG